MEDRAGETIRRTLLILRIISSFDGRWFGVSDMATKAGLAKSTTHRYLSVFVDEKILDYEPATSKYQAMSRKRTSH